MTHWDLPHPHVVTLAVQGADIDAYGHVNNSVYLTWLDRAAWSHSAALGMPLERCTQIRRGMAAQRIEIDYLRAALADDELEAATWIVAGDGRLRVGRRFQVYRPRDRATLARAQVQYVCINLDSGRAVRMPAEFVAAYAAPSA
ncbi:MAG: acyl-CoA thioesterase [Proteobacteria bacterium]|nr:acyl-CoA thioesterase [Pseudomonadota bacterium]